ncbi:hypothetical protein MML48_10g00001223 [Holotrichia oblita]|uniref:Uncharacterized protein n=1 Tax=Holotrichia oblita TaxID=644536 RepID=A0ACB9SGF9_HOLOL|nr:hypothetical protein MML48_10g00001223 [Holotrichia oblita]
MIGDEELFLDVELFNIINAVNPERKVYRSRKACVDMSNWDDKEFIKRYRVSKETVNILLEHIAEQLRPATDRNYAVAPLQQLLLTLRYLATGSFYITVGDYGGVHKSTAGKIIQKCIFALAELGDQYIHLPADEPERHATVLQFARVARFPRVVGAIDCTHIKLQSPGDSGYPLRSYLLTPLDQPRTAAEHLYNEAQIRTRNIIERTFGIWKRRFPILSLGIRTKLELAQAIIVASAVVHNLACAHHDELPDDIENVEDPIGDAREVDQNHVGVAVRNSLIRYFEQFL